ncbi:hypothetical protein CTAYLR_005074 [Chrysophaeum taylorii]|uniref:EngB-type G domain-containing protein n=1 Tax=Chrysophaeum taylorii TaxID=2483200 RepID=A0AAD7UC25_9STRA|nr:hypothetical protein CTAYLR_005074 [Chrysophaeum taylorii]
MGGFKLLFFAAAAHSLTTHPNKVVVAGRRCVAVYGGRPKRPKESAVAREERLAAEEWQTRDSSSSRRRRPAAPPEVTKSDEKNNKKKKKKPSRVHKHKKDAVSPQHPSPRLRRRIKFDALEPARFAGSFDDVGELPEWRTPEVAFLGRSNVGKSSMLNALVGARKPVAVVGQRPGRTRRINVFELSDARGVCCALTDLPGYGFAKISKGEQAAIARFVEAYLDTRPQLGLVVLIVDARRNPDDTDRDVLEALRTRGVPVVVVATKIDKCAGGRDLMNRLDELNAALALPENEPLYFSAVTRQGRPELWHAINEVLLTGETPTPPPPLEDDNEGAIFEASAALRDEPIDPKALLPDLAAADDDDELLAFH